ncbi:hypothetical protein BJY14_007597 [Actinomadura luteofluorescens]|uniref:Uncharacterized protein n=1 Tax=Actinomadura luteofluorescens TaxID=46163 RepID=A0A7Y9EPM8_9ACTN|nr:hypothetical protein [Actinomadura luteofluorescens]
MYPHTPTSLLTGVPPQPNSVTDRSAPLQFGM